MARRKPSMSWLIALAVVAFLAPFQPALADLAPGGGRGAPAPEPGPNPIEDEKPADRTAETENAVPLEVRVDPKAKQSRLIIPKNLLAKDGRSNTTASSWRNNTIFGGITLALVITCGGLTMAFARRRRPVMAVATTFIAMLSVLTFTGIAMANLAAPDERRELPDVQRITLPVVASPVQTPHVTLPSTTEVVVETVDDGDSIILVIGKEPSPPTSLQPTASPEPR
jgi:hypothetical protein